MPAKRDTPKPFTGAGGPALIAEARPGAGVKLARFSGNAYTGAPMKPEGWAFPIICDLAGLKVPADQHRPVLRQHDHEQIVGHTDAVKVTDKGVEIAGPFSGEKQHTDKVTVPARNGLKWQLSIGANPLRTSWLEAGETATVNGREVTGPMTVSHETELGEISFVPLGADGDTSASVKGSNHRKGKAMFQKAALKLARTQGVAAAMKFSDEEIDKMDDKEAKAALKKCMAEEGDEDKDETDKEKADAKAKAKAKAADDDEPDEKDDEKKAEANRRHRIEASRKADAAEARRVAGIKARCQKFPGVNKVKLEDGRTVDLIPHAIEAGWSADEAELHARRADRPQGGGSPHLHFGTRPELAAMDGDQASAVLECAVFQANRSFELLDDSFYDRKTKERDPIPGRDAARFKAEMNRRYPEKIQDAAHTIFKGRIGLQQMLTIIARQGGYDGSDSITSDNLSQVAAACMRIQADGGSTISVGNVTSNVQNKFLLQGYLFTEQSWREICAIRSVKDFKATKSINLFGDVEFQDLGTSGELANATLQDQAFANQVGTSGRIITIPRTTIINDDLGAFGQVPMLMGRGAGLKLNKVFWAKLMNPGNDEGGSTAFFAAVHTLLAGQQGNSNYSSGGGSALASAGLTAATLLFDNQVDPKGYPLGIDAEILLYPPDLETAAWELMNSQFIVQSAGATTKQPSENRWKGRYKPVKSRYLNKSAFTGYSTTAWYLFANPGILPAIEMAFLNGQEMPTVQTAGPDFQFNVLGITTRAFFDIGCNVQNFRGAVKSAGA